MIFEQSQHIEKIKKNQCKYTLSNVKFQFNKIYRQCRLQNREDAYAKAYATLYRNHCGYTTFSPISTSHGNLLSRFALRFNVLGLSNLTVPKFTLLFWTMMALYIYIWIIAEPWITICGTKTIYFYLFISCIFIFVYGLQI